MCSLTPWSPTWYILISIWYSAAQPYQNSLHIVLCGKTSKHKPQWIETRMTDLYARTSPYAHTHTHTVSSVVLVLTKLGWEWGYTGITMSICLSIQPSFSRGYLLNCSTFFDKTWCGGALLWAGVSCAVIKVTLRAYMTRHTLLKRMSSELVIRLQSSFMWS